jgi:hypothetical protein
MDKASRQRTFIGTDIPGSSTPSPDGHDRLPGAPPGAESRRVGVCIEHFAHDHA